MASFGGERRRKRENLGPVPQVAPSRHLRWSCGRSFGQSLSRSLDRRHRI
jgi:hypothetical protein